MVATEQRRRPSKLRIFAIVLVFLLSGEFVLLFGTQSSVAVSSPKCLEFVLLCSHAMVESETIDHDDDLAL